MLRGLIKRGRALAVGAVFAFAITTSAVAGFARPQTVDAAGPCDKVNIVYCGLGGSTVSSYISSFKSYYNNNTSGHNPAHKDIKTVYNYGGATQAIVNGMNTSNTFLGTVYDNGDVFVGNRKVGTSAWVAARFSVSGAKRIPNTDNVWLRKITDANFAMKSRALIVYMQNDKMVFGVEEDCGNLVTANPTPPPAPEKKLACVDLVRTPVVKPGETSETALTQKFEGKASAQNTPITKYVFNFGNGKSETKNTSATSASTTHTYTKPGTYKAGVVVYSGSLKDGGVECETTFTIKEIKKPKKLACVKLTATPIIKNGTSFTLAYTFTAEANVENTTITQYVFDFGDRTQPVPVPSNSEKVTKGYVFAKPGQYTVKVTVHGSGVNPATSDNCEVMVQPKAPPECPPESDKPECKPPENCPIPGKEHLPVGDECKEEETPPPTELPKTGAGSIAGVAGLFSGTSITAAAAHRIIRRRFDSE